MKKLKLYTIIFSAVLLGACDNDLLDTKPYDSISSSGMWKNESLIDMGVSGVYNVLRQDNVGEYLWYFDQYSFTGMCRDSKSLTSGNITANDGMFSDYWKQNYEGVHRANDAIVHLMDEANTPLTPQKRGRLIAECKFLRAFFYFNLNEVFKGVPIYLTPISVKECTKGRDTEAKVWETIITDLTDCINEPNFPNFYKKGDATWGRATKAAAYALRGRAYMWTKEYKKAIADLKMVGTLGPQLYQGEYKMLFKEANEQCPEMIFSVQNIGVKDFGSFAHKYLGSRVAFGSCWNSYLPHPDFVESFEEKDGKPFNWDDYLPGYNSMTPTQRMVFFLRDGLTASEIDAFTKSGADMSKYLPVGNEARIRKAYEDRDPRLNALVITPYSTFVGSYSGIDCSYTLRWPYRGYDNKVPFDLRTDTNSFYYYLWRKWVAEGSTETPNREFGAIDQPLIRYADVVLMLAEALVEDNQIDEAIQYVNQIRTRVGAAPIQNTDPSKPTFANGQDNMRERVRNERRWELALEGINLFDEMRWGTWKSKKFYTGNGIKQVWGTVTSSYSWGGDYLYNWAIPQTEIETNRNITQNPGWIN